MWITFAFEMTKTLTNKRKIIKDILIKSYLLCKKEPIFAVLLKNT